MSEWLCEDTGAAVAAQVGHDKLELVAPLAQRGFPILARTRETVQQEQRLASSVNFEVELDAVEGCDGAVVVGQ